MVFTSISCALDTCLLNNLHINAKFLILVISEKPWALISILMIFSPTRTKTSKVFFLSSYVSNGSSTGINSKISTSSSKTVLRIDSSISFPLLPWAILLNIRSFLAVSTLGVSSVIKISPPRLYIIAHSFWVFCRILPKLKKLQNCNFFNIILYFRKKVSF